MFLHQGAIPFNMRTVVLFLLCFWLLCFSQPSLAKDVLRPGENLTDDKTSFLVSAEQTFALGFFTPQGSTDGTGTKRYLGIWYNHSGHLEKTVVWVANREKPVLDSSGVFQISDNNGNLEVVGTNGEIYWSSQLEVEGSSSANRTVQLMDSGNLVLLDNNHYLWQSFRHPTDTFLPGMKMDVNLQLTSWRNPSDPGSGNFTFKMAYTRNISYAILENQQLYWENDGVNSDALTAAALNYLANFTLNLTANKIISKSSNRTWESYFPKYQNTRILMHSNGEIQFLNWENLEWVKQWWQPADKCNIYNYCGNFSSCNTNNWMHCKCLPGFRPRLPENQHSEGNFPGCVRKSTWHNNKEMIFLNLTMIKVDKPDQRKSAETEAECQSLCLDMSSPQCQAYSYNVSTYSDRSSVPCSIWASDLPTLTEQYRGDGVRDLSILVKSSDIASTAKSCEPCGTYTIPYPLSTGPYCGDPMYNKFRCDESTGQVSFVMPGEEPYRVTWIDEDDRKFHIQTNRSNHCDSNHQNDKPISPFNVTNWCFNEDEIEISWRPAPEPPCNEAIDCEYWPHSTCIATNVGTHTCHCDSKYKWNAVSLSCSQEEPSRNHSTLILTVTLAGMVFLISTILFAYVWRKKIADKLEKASARIQESLNDSERHVKHLIGMGSLEDKNSDGIELPCYTFGSILAATDNFSDSKKLGRGGYGPVYKGTFPGGQEIAVKRLSSVSTQGLQEFKNEVVLIAKLQHRNLVRLRGYCIRREEKILLYEYMPNKSLDSFIFDRTRTFLLDWPMRFDIILGFARGLLYLHQDSRLRVIHRDLKTSNILLDEEMNPKISDFGLAKIIAGKETEASTERVVGSYGYMAPEYALDGIFSTKSDVFSFGVVVLEILSGKRNTGFYQSKQIASLLGYAWRLWTENNLLALMDPSLGESCNENQFIKCALVGLLCVQDEPGDRPTMSNVVIMLDSENATIPTPTQPTFFAMKDLSNSASSSSKPEISQQFESSYQEGR